tara:strand:+ start:283 stop:543 length:261 start_codon:yes stop_codon:yes gene_type:complete
MTVLLKLFIGKLVLLLLWGVAIVAGVYVYLNNYPAEGWKDWLCLAPVGTLLSLLVILDLIPSVVIKMLDMYQTRYGYAMKYEDEED